MMMEYCGRPESFNEDILRNMSKLIAKEDILIHLGDVCIGNDIMWHENLMDHVACKKWLVKGNHDRKSNSWYIGHGWDWVGYQFSDTYYGKKILFSHRPLPNWSNNGFDFNIHGHFHNSNHHIKDPEWIQSPKHKLLAIENTNYCPVTLQHFIKEAIENENSITL